jgi:arginine exporter protein ArgO
MKPIDIFVLFGAGYVSGLSIASGFMFQAIRKFNQTSWSRASAALWSVAALTNIALGALMPILLIGVVVVGDQPDRPDFWPRMWLFAAGVLSGAALLFFGVSQLNKGVRSIVGEGA